MKVDAHSSETGLDLKTHRLCSLETWDVISLPFSRREVYRAVQEGTTLPFSLSASDLFETSLHIPALATDTISISFYCQYNTTLTDLQAFCSKPEPATFGMCSEQWHFSQKTRRIGHHTSIDARGQRGPSGRGSPRVWSHVPAMWFSFTLMLNSFSGNWAAWSFTSRILMLKTKELSKSFPVRWSTTSK